MLKPNKFMYVARAPYSTEADRSNRTNPNPTNLVPANTISTRSMRIHDAIRELLTYIPEPKSITIDRELVE